MAGSGVRASGSPEPTVGSGVPGPGGAYRLRRVVNSLFGFPIGDCGDQPPCVASKPEIPATSAQDRWPRSPAPRVAAAAVFW
jgi:hypothetical protein